MENTTHYGLKKWEASDRVSRLEFNNNYDKLDTAIYAAKKTADQAQTLGNTLQTLASDHTAAISALKTSITLLGNCRIETGSYTGTGDATYKRTLTFSRTPQLLLIQGNNPSGAILAALNGNKGLFITLSNTESIAMTWSGKSITWSGSASAATVMNNANTLYRYMALMVQ